MFVTMITTCFKSSLVTCIEFGVIMCMSDISHYQLWNAPKIRRVCARKIISRLMDALAHVC
jgi:hypothetical protein